MKENLLMFSVLALFITCSGRNPVDPPVSNNRIIKRYTSKGDQSQLLFYSDSAARFSASGGSGSIVEVDSAITYQSVDGFGFTLTGGSAYLINRMGAAERQALLQELFGSTGNSLRISYLRVSIGASDLSAQVFSYDDLPVGQTDPNLVQFSLAQDTVDLIPLLQQIRTINPEIRIMGSPWSAPVWMKDNGSSIGGSLRSEYQSVYANYLLKYVQSMQVKGIPIDAITIQNEPQHGGNNPSMVMSATQQSTFIRDHLGPAFRTAGLSTKIIVWDHNCDNPGYPISVLSDAAANAFVDGSAFHLYGGNINALSMVHDAFPTKNLYFTEQWTGANGSFSGDLFWHVKNVVIGSLRNWSRVVLEWNLANDVNYGPHTPGGCTECKGALTVQQNSINRNVSYYIIGHAARFIPPGSVRIASSEIGGISQVVFKTPQGDKVMIALNEGASPTTFQIKYQGSIAAVTLSAQSVNTLVWK